MTVFLRPAPANKPVKYLESIELSGLVVNPQNSLAIYTSKASQNIGATGATGATGAAGTNGTNGTDGVDFYSLDDTIIASCSDELTAITADAVVHKTEFRAPYAMDLAAGYIRANLRTAPTGAIFTVDVHMNGLTMFSTLLTIDIGEKTSVTAATPAVLSVTDVPDDALFEVFVTQVGSGTAGTGLKIAVTGVKVEP